MLKAESGLARTAARYGVWPDVSFGYAQLTISTAAGYGVGDGSNTPENIVFVRDYLFDRWQSINLGAVHLSGCYGQADAAGYSDWGISHDLAASVIFNAGFLPPKDSRWWYTWRGNVENYKRALEWAQKVVGA